MSLWIVSSNNVDHIETAHEKLLWGFWYREAGQKQKQNWRRFIGTYNRIKPFDILVFQIARSGEIHAIGAVKERYYDDQTPVWKEEKEQNKVLFPWRVSLYDFIFKEAVC